MTPKTAHFSFRLQPVTAALATTAFHFTHKPNMQNGDEERKNYDGFSQVLLDDDDDVQCATQCNMVQMGLQSVNAFPLIS